MRCLPRRAFLFAVGVLAPCVLSSCAGAPDAARADTKVLALFKTEPRTAPLSKDESQRIFDGHLADMQRLAREGRLVMAGPYGKAKSDAALCAQLAADIAREDAHQRTGTTPPPGSGMRGYVVLTATDGVHADQALGDDGGVLLRSRLGDGRGWYVLDAVDVAAARTLLGERVGTLGEVTMDDWYATDLLVDLPLRLRG